MGHSAFFGIALICESYTLFAVSLFGQISSFLFIKFVEEPHMLDLYGADQIRNEAGFMTGAKKVVKREVGKVAKKVGLPDEEVKDVLLSLKRFIRERELGDFIRVVSRKKRNDEVEEQDTESERKEGDAAQDTISAAKTEDGWDSVDESTVPLLEKCQYDISTGQKEENDDEFIKASRNAKLSLSRSVESITGTVSSVVSKASAVVMESTDRIDKGKYSLEIIGVDSSEPIRFVLGQPIRVGWTADLTSWTKRDWIGVYSVAKNISRDVTTASSKGLWLWVTGSKDEDDLSSPASPVQSSEDLIHDRAWATNQKNISFVENKRLVKSEVDFSGANLPWEIGVYEFRYHFHGKYGVLTQSRVFEIYCKLIKFFMLYLPSYLRDPQVNPVSALTDVGVDEIEVTLLPVLVRCLELRGEEELDPEASLLAQGRMKLGTSFSPGQIPDFLQIFEVTAAHFSKEEERVSKRIVHAVKTLYGIEFNWTVVPYVKSLNGLVKRVRPFNA